MNLNMGISTFAESFDETPKLHDRSANFAIASPEAPFMPRTRRPVPSVDIGPAGSLRPLLPADGPRSDGPSASGVLPKPIDEASSSRQQYEYDIILVHPNDNPGSGLRSQLIEKTEVALRRRTIASRMRFIGLKLSREVSRSGNEVLLKIAAPDRLLEEFAERTSMEKRLETGGYTDYTRETRKLFARAASGTLFSSLERQRLIISALELGLSEGGCDLDLSLEIERGVLTAVVPVHEPTIGSGALAEQWLLAQCSWWANQPLDQIRDYFGERLALYFAFLQHLTRSLLLPGLVGLFVVLGSFWYGTVDNPLAPAYSVFIMVWTPWFAKTWRREEAQLAFRWNVEVRGR